MKNIVFIGMPGSGKTIIATMLATRLGRPYIDIDSVIAARHFASSASIRAKFGENYFRDLESGIVGEASRNNNVIMSTGDGVVLLPKNIDVLSKNGILVFLKASPDTLLLRLGQNPLFLPLLSNEPNIRQKMDRLWRDREPLYRKAAHETVDTERLNLEQVVDEVVKKLKGRSDIEV